MSFIREHATELTGYQESEPWNPEIDVNIDFVMVYGNDPTLSERIEEYRNRGYKVHLMTGMAWGNYQDYLYGRWDGHSHWDEAQQRANGEIVGHGKDIPYMVPTVSFANYISETLRIAIDSGVEAIHLEEPEFWDFSGYSQAFKNEYEIYYREPWQDPQESLTAHYRSAQLKAYLYARTIRRVADSVKEYSYRKFGKAVRVYIPTHSLINYTQWKIMSPEGMLNDIPSLDGFIAQVWTGTSRTKNVYRGELAERTFETAYCEYSVMQELVNGSNRQMWFLADPIEDNPRYSWPDYQQSYSETVIASLLHPQVHHYEICPWPNRVFNANYPKGDHGVPIPDQYKTLLNNMFQTLGNMDQESYFYDHNNDIHLGIALSDTGMYQRSYPTTISDTNYDVLSKSKQEFYSSDAFPMFYGLSMGLVKRGLPIRCVQIDNVLRTPNYLDGLKYLVLSYDFMKPLTPAINSEIAAWVQNGGTLIYVGNDQDPYNRIPAWWNNNGETRRTPLRHLLDMLDIGVLAEGTSEVGRGHVLNLRVNPAEICASIDLENEYISLITSAIELNQDTWQKQNYLQLHRGSYVVSSVMKESTDKKLKLSGHFVNLLESDFSYQEDVVLEPGENSLLYDLDKLDVENIQIIGTTGRILNADTNDNVMNIEVKTTGGVNSYLAIANAAKVKMVNATDEFSADVKCIVRRFDHEYMTVNYQGTGSLIRFYLFK